MNRVGLISRILVLVCFVLLLWVGCASAATFVVNQTSPACASSIDYFASIQAAVDSANDGDVIVVCPYTREDI